MLENTLKYKGKRLKKLESVYYWSFNTYCIKGWQVMEESFALHFTPVESEYQIRQVADLAAEIWPEHYAPILSAEQIDYMVDAFQSAVAITMQVRKKGYRYYLLSLAGEKIGYVGIHVEDGKLFLSKLYLHVSVRGHGFGRAAMAFLEGFCQGMGLSAIWLTVNRHNTSSIAAYEKMGFVKVREEKADIGNGFVMDDFIMEKSLQ